MIVQAFAYSHSESSPHPTFQNTVELGDSSKKVGMQSPENIDNSFNFDAAKKFNAKPVASKRCKQAMSSKENKLSEHGQ